MKIEKEELKKISAEIEEKYKYKIVAEIPGGYSGAICLKVKKDSKIFFCKIYAYKININNIKYQLQIYKNIEVDTLKILDYGSILNYKYTFIIYNYIQGVSLESYIKDNNIQEDKIIEYGYRVGKIAKKLKEYKDFESEKFDKISIEEQTENLDNKITNMIGSERFNIINNLITKDKLYCLLKELKQYSSYFKIEKINLIHEDLKTGNVIINKDKLYIIDCESMSLSYNVFDFKYTITWDLVYNYTLEVNYLKGYFKGLYDGKIPKYLKYQIKYIFIYNFLNALISELNKDIIRYDKIEYYILEINKIISDNRLDEIIECVLY